MVLKIYTYPNNPRVWKSLIAAKYNKVEIEEVIVTLGKDNKTPEFLRLNPQGKVPVLETPEGAIWESNAILRYVAGLKADSTLSGNTYYEKALVQQWLDFEATEVAPAVRTWILPILGYLPFNQQAYFENKKAVSSIFDVLNKHLLYHTYLASNNITIADLSVALSLYKLLTLVLDEKFRSKYVNVMRWFNTIVNQKEVASVIGEVVLAVEEKKAEVKKEVKKEEKKPAAPKKEETPEPAPVKEEKKVNPLTLLPASPMRLDDVKRLYFLKQPYNPEFFNEFWGMFDKEGYSIWECKYLYPDDWMADYVADNLIVGFLNRCELVKKWAFGVIHAEGDKPENFEGGGVWIFRGQDVIEEMKDTSDYDEYQFTKLNPDSEEDRAKIVQHFQAEEINGKKVCVRRYCK